MRKSQMEIMGLAIIIVIIIIGLLLYIKFNSKGPDTSVMTTMMDTKLSSNMITALLRTTLDCKDVEIKNLLQDCADGITNLDYCGTNNPCDKAKGVIDGVLGRTLATWGYKYQFTAKLDTNSLVSTASGTCARNLIAETYPIPTNKGTMLVRLAICK